MSSANLILGDSLEVLKTLEAESIDCCVTDPPYGLSFMGKKWDYDVPSVDLWREVLRVLKPGAHLLSFGGTRTYHRMVVNIEDAGFEIRDQLQWLYSSGFPKSHNLEGEHEGYGTALKPANEPICLARKPFKCTVAQNVQEHGTGALNIDGCRIGSEGGTRRDGKADKPNESGWENMRGHKVAELDAGRWPSNVLLDEEAAKILDEKEEGASRFFYVAKAATSERNKGCEGMPEVECQTGCSGDMPIDDGGESRDRFKKTATNHHPTVKPVDLMCYLVRMVAPTGAVVLDPFLGSGTTGIAANLESCNFVGIEINAEYFKIAEARIKQEQSQKKLF